MRSFLPVLLALAYPGIVYLALQVAQPRSVALCILLFLGLRATLAGRRLMDVLAVVRLPLLAVGAVLAISAARNDPLSLRLAPALVSFALLAAFLRSLSGPESVVEGYARLQLGTLSEEDSRYCRRVTRLWCGFFVVNGLTALWLALAASLEAWALYTGLIAYLLMGAMFAAEYVYRLWRFRRYFGAPTDPLFRRIFPPRSP